jgi:hypothetical protein
MNFFVAKIFFKEDKLDDQSNHTDYDQLIETESVELK